MTSKVSVSVGLVTFNRRELMIEAIQRLLASPAPVDRIFVVDNASHDGTKEALLELQRRHGPKIQPIFHSENEGSAGGFYAAARAAYDFGSEWILLTDDDAHVEPETLGALLNSPVAADPRTGGLGCFVVDTDRRPFLPNLQCKVDRQRFEFRAISLPNPSDLSPIPTDTNSFDGFLIHRRALKKCGFPDQEYFTWFDDLDLSLRISKHFSLWMVPAAKIIHLGQPRSDERRLPIFRAKVQVYDWQGLWRQFYRSRNYYALMRDHSSGPFFHYKFAKQMLRDLLTPLYFRQDHLGIRLKLALKAAWDGYFRNLGRTISIHPPFSATGKSNPPALSSDQKI